MQALRRLLCDESLRAELGRRGEEIVRQKYQFAAFQSALEKILDEGDSGLSEPRVAPKVL